MRHTKTVEIPARTEIQTDYRTCDLCGEQLPKWGSGPIDDVEVCHKTGYGYPEGGHEKRFGVDLCGKCFEEKLILWLRTQGAEPRIEECDW